MGSWGCKYCFKAKYNCCCLMYKDLEKAITCLHCIQLLTSSAILHATNHSHSGQPQHHRGAFEPVGPAGAFVCQRPALTVPLPGLLNLMWDVGWNSLNIRCSEHRTPSQTRILFWLRGWQMIGRHEDIAAATKLGP